MFPEYKDRLNIHGCSSAIQVIENLEKQVEHQKETILSLRQEVERLEATIEALESLRPQWAKGYSSDSIAAQTAHNALADIWGVLGVTSQTEAMAKLHELKTERDALAAHVELLANGIGYAIEALNTEVANLGTMRSEEIKELQAIKKTVPQTRLAEVRAQAAKDGIIAATFVERSEHKEHANKIRNGKEQTND